MRLPPVPGARRGRHSYRNLQDSLECVSERTRSAFCWMVALGWLANLAAGMIPALNYQPNELATAPMMLVLGSLLAAKRKRRNESG